MSIVIDEFIDNRGEKWKVMKGFSKGISGKLYTEFVYVNSNRTSYAQLTLSSSGIISIIPKPLKPVFEKVEEVNV